MAQLIAYSRAGQNYVSGTIKHLEAGNTEAAAKLLSGLLRRPNDSWKELWRLMEF